jgi:Fe-Mn family superoxide dismutase
MKVDTATRRQFLQGVGRQSVGGVLASSLFLSGCHSEKENVKTTPDRQHRHDSHRRGKDHTAMQYTLPDLPYDYDALAPHIDEQTLRIHHDKHHAGYVKKLNNALEGHEEHATEDIADLMALIVNLPDAIRTGVQRNGGQHFNHSFYWESMAPKGEGSNDPTGALADDIRQTFGSVDKLKELFTKTAGGCFGSGWGWLYLNQDSKLAVAATSNELNPLMKGISADVGTPLLVVDVWEHAYYLKYQNRRTEYLEAFWKVVDWDKVSQRYSKARSM